MSEALRLADALDRAPYSSPCTNDAAEELRRLHKVEEAYNAWHEKTEWVQDTSQPCELGMHRADVLRGRIERLVAENEALRADAECFRFWVREAANAPGDMAKLIAKCLTEQDYRDAIMPVAFAAEKAIDAARSKT